MLRNSLCPLYLLWRVGFIARETTLLSPMLLPTPLDKFLRKELVPNNIVGYAQASWILKLMTKKFISSRIQ
jgi:hypothetical protein